MNGVAAISGSEKDARALLERLRREGVLRAAASAGQGEGRAFLPTGVEELDRAIGGGLPRGRIVEVVGAMSSGRTAFLFGVLASATARGEQAAWIDAADAFDPAAAALCGVRLERVLWIRPERPWDAFRAADIVLDAGGFGVVVLDAVSGVRDSRLTTHDSRLAPHDSRRSAPWPRLALRAERSGSVLVVSGEHRAVGTFAAVAVGMRRASARWLGGGVAPLLLDRLDVRLEILRSKVGGAAGPVRWTSAAKRDRSTDAA